MTKIQELDRITFDPAVMGGKPCIRNIRVTVDTIVGLVESGYDQERILQAYPFLEAEDIQQALDYISLDAINEIVNAVRRIRHEVESH